MELGNQYYRLKGEQTNISNKKFFIVHRLTPSILVKYKKVFIIIFHWLFFCTQFFLFNIYFIKLYQESTIIKLRCYHYQPSSANNVGQRMYKIVENAVLKRYGEEKGRRRRWFPQFDLHNRARIYTLYNIHLSQIFHCDRKADGPLFYAGFKIFSPYFSFFERPPSPPWSRKPYCRVSSPASMAFFSQEKCCSYNSKKLTYTAKKWRKENADIDCLGCSLIILKNSRQRRQ
jgi:hypothetical protein